MSDEEVIKNLLNEYQTMTLSMSSEKNIEAVDNMLQIDGAWLRKQILTESGKSFLAEKLCDLYDEKAQLQNISGLVYLWFDFQTDQLRISFIRETDSSKLPFEVKLLFARNSAEIVKKVYAAGQDVIPWSELKPIAVWDENLLNENRDYTLDIFVRKVGLKR